jgi:dynein heavy chain
VNQENIQKFTQECDIYLEEIEEQTTIADTEKQVVGEQKEVIGKEAERVAILKEQTEVDLQKAMPAYESAIAALDSLNKKDLTEIKSYVTPPQKVERVLEAVMILIERPTNWAEAKKKLGEQTFLEDLKNFDKDNVSDKTLRRIEKYTSDPELEPDKVGIVSAAAKSLCLWVRAIENYGRVWR